MKHENSRNMGVELLRIVLMLFIIEGHLLTHTAIREEVQFLTPQWVFIWGIQAITVCAVNGFVLISGYYQKSTSLKLEKVFRLWGQVLFYSIVLFLISLSWGNSPSALDVLRTVLPITCKQYWFFTIYIFLYLLSPFINTGLNKLSRSGFRFLLGVLVLFTIIKPTIFPFVDQYDPTEGFGIVSFLTLYVIGSYLRQYREDIRFKVPLLIISVILVFFSKVVLEIIVQRNGLGVGTGLMYHYNTVFQVINSILLLYIFKKIRIDESGKAGKSIVFLSSSVFGVYLIHEHPAIRSLLWERLISIRFLSDLNIIQLAAILISVPIGVFIICTIIDHARKAIKIPPLSKRFVVVVSRIQSSCNPITEEE